MSRIVIACPKGVMTGGPEALHQLGAEIRTLGLDAYLWDPITNPGSTTSNDYFAQYEVDWTSDAPVSGDTLVIPEVMADLIPRYYSDCLCVFWWLSVDNFFASNRLPLEVLIQLFPKVIHTAQSHYAKDFLQQKGVSEVLILTDYLNKSFETKRNELFSPGHLERRTYDVAINPQKGLERSLQVIDSSEGLRIIQLQGMTRDEIINALSSSKIYLDLGNHPGTDRIPREAALLGCVVITNIRGSAGNEIDVPLDGGLFKCSDEPANFEFEVDQIIRNVLNSVDEARRRQQSYVEWILDAPNRFQIEVNNLVRLVNTLTIDIQNVERITANCVLLAYPVRDAVVRDRDQLLVERDAVVRDRDQLLVERDAVVKEKKLLSKEHHQLLRRYNTEHSELQAIKRSFFWRLSTPIRALAQFIKKWIS